MRRKEIILDEVLFYLRETDLSYQQIAFRVDVGRTTLHSYLIELGINYEEIRLQRNEEVLKRVEEIRKKHKKKKAQERSEIINKIKNQECKISELKQKLESVIYSTFISIAADETFSFGCIVSQIGRMLGLSETEVETFLIKSGVSKTRFNLGFYSMTEEEQKEFLKEESRVENKKAKTRILKLIRYSKGSLQDIADSQDISIEIIKAILQEKSMSVENIRKGVYDSDLGL